VWVEKVKDCCLPFEGLAHFSFAGSGLSEVLAPAALGRPPPRLFYASQLVSPLLPVWA